MVNNKEKQVDLLLERLSVNIGQVSSIVFPKANDKGITKYLSYNGI
ncbi:hypothetical protein [Wolbachia endosymbiont of Frankliniella intonsa]|nr:hypothetical protein [Wolbachia endosymbiont of Frankliniella intonsa]WGJ61990.1 hypothetical protein M3L71_07025 [Wolbachia endosymbiont of Frankliniella intonsa]